MEADCEISVINKTRIAIVLENLRQAVEAGLHALDAVAGRTDSLTAGLKEEGPTAWRVLHLATPLSVWASPVPLACCKCEDAAIQQQLLAACVPTLRR